MNIFNLNTKKKHLEQLEIKIADLLADSFPEFRKVLKISKLYGIEFTIKPEGIYLSRGYNPKQYEEIKRNHNKHFDLLGIYVFEKKTKKYVELKLNYLHNSLTKIEIENPKKFHSTFDLNNLKIEDVEIKNLKLENPDVKNVLKALKNIDEEKLNLLDIENTFEIEIDEKIFYVILDSEDGNYIVTDKKGIIYRLIHDHKEVVKKIAENPAEFFKIYNGKKSEIEKIMNT